MPSLQCSGCRAENVPEARFCNQCGTRLDAADAARARTPAAEAEHRQLTVLFADLVGSTELAAELGPEDWRETVRRFQSAADACVAGYEGTVAQYLGDGVLVYFGYPLAHENDPERALLAGLALLAQVDALNDDLEREYGVRIRARLAAHTGSVVIGEMGGRMRTEQLALGEAPNVAARLQDHAPHGSLVTSPATLALVGGRFETEALGERELKGVREPMAVYRIVRAAAGRSRFRFGATEKRSVFVGRARETALLRDAFAVASRGRAELVWITGEAGIGKSRLLHELEHELTTVPVRWLDLNASAYAQHSPFEPFRVLLGDAFGSDPEAARARLVASGVDPAAVAPALEALLGIRLLGAAEGSTPLLAEHRRAATIAALCDWVLGLAEDRPVVLAVEDLHAMDPSTVEVLERIVERARDTAGAHLLVAVTARSGTKAPDGWSAIATTIELEALSPRDVAELIENVAAGVGISDELRTQLGQRSDGNPLFAEELARALTAGDDPVEATAVPASLRDPLRARLDRTGAAQATAQLASALGREFSYALLRAVSPLDDAELDSQLAGLVDAGLVVERPSLEGASYQFRHALIRDAAYGSMLRRTRQARHGEIARAMKERFGALARARPELLAHHQAAAGAHAEAAVEWLRAAKRASDACAFREVLSLVEQGLESFEQIPAAERTAKEVALHLYRAHAYAHLRGSGDPDALASYQRARALAERIDEPAGACMALLGVHGSVMLTGSTRDAAEIAEELLERAEQSGQAALIKSANLAAGLTAFARGEWPRARRHLSAATGLGVVWQAEAQLPRAIWMCGEWETALELCDEYAEQVREQTPLARAEVASGVATTHLLVRDYERALTAAREWEAVARQERMELYLAAAICVEGAALVGLGDAAAGAARIEAGFAMVRGTASESYLAFFAPFRADAFLAAGDSVRAIALADEGLADEAARERHVCEPELLRVKGEALARLPDRQDEAEAVLLEAVQAARRCSSLGWELRAVLSASRFLSERGRGRDARALLAPCYASIREGHDQADVAEARALLYRLDRVGS